MAQQGFWISANYSLQMVREAFRIEATTFRLDLVKVRPGITPYVDRAVLPLRNLPSVHVGIGEALRDRYAPVEGHLPGRLAAVLKQLEEAPQRPR
jgi:hypothetical protein